jgi:hypothetical protein
MNHWLHQDAVGIRIVFRLRAMSLQDLVEDARDEKTHRQPENFGDKAFRYDGKFGGAVFIPPDSPR